MTHHAQVEYWRARDALLGLRGRRTPEALCLLETLSQLMDDPDGSMCATTRGAEALLRR